MIAGILRQAGREPVHNRAGSNMHWGVATALLEQRGDEGLFELDEAWLPRVAPQLRPRLLVLGNLFRDQLDRYGELERLAEEWAELVESLSGELRARALRGRPADRRPRARPRAEAPARGHLLRHRGHEPGAARAAARPRRQALPPLRRALRVRARVRRPPRPLHLPQLRRRPPHARRRRDRGRAARHGRLAGRDRDAPGRAAPGAAPAGPLQRLQRARRGHGGPALGGRAGDDPGRAGVDARRLRPRRDDRGRRASRSRSC